MTQKHYLLIVSPGPPMIFRVPWPMPKWRSILRATTAVMKAHGLRQKDVFSLEGLVPYPSDREDKDRAFAVRIDGGYDGVNDVILPFWLYDWSGDAFKLVRAGTVAT